MDEFPCSQTLGIDVGSEIARAVEQVRAAAAERRDCVIDFLGVEVPIEYKADVGKGHVRYTHDAFFFNFCVAFEWGLRVAAECGLKPADKAGPDAE